MANTFLPGGGGTDDNDTTDGTTDTGSGSGGPLWSSIAPKSVRTFAAAPVAFIVGAFLDIVVGGFENFIEAFIGAILAVFDAFASIPRSAESILLDAGGSAGAIILSALNGMFSSLMDAAAMAGPGAPILAAVVVALVILVAAYAIRAIWTGISIL